EAEALLGERRLPGLVGVLEDRLAEEARVLRLERGGARQHLAQVRALERRVAAGVRLNAAAAVEVDAELREQERDPVRLHEVIGEEALDEAGELVRGAPRRRGRAETVEVQAGDEAVRQARRRELGVTLPHLGERVGGARHLERYADREGIERGLRLRLDHGQRLRGERV